jgi:hypothetical protein
MADAKMPKTQYPKNQYPNEYPKNQYPNQKISLKKGAENGKMADVNMDKIWIKIWINQICQNAKSCPYF